jgi:hypothetical protein
VRGPLETEATLRGLASGTDLEEVIPDSRPGAVLSGQRRHDVNVIRGMPDRSPPHGPVVVRSRETGPLHNLLCDSGPLGAGQDQVAGRGPDGAVPNGLVAGRPPSRERHEQQARQAAGVGRAFRVAACLKVRRIVEAGDQVRTSVLVRPAGAVEVAEQPARIRAPGDLPDHASPSQLAHGDSLALSSACSR